MSVKGSPQLSHKIAIPVIFLSDTRVLLLHDLRVSLPDADQLTMRGKMHWLQTKPRPRFIQKVQSTIVKFPCQSLQPGDKQHHRSCTSWTRREHH